MDMDAGMCLCGAALGHRQTEQDTDRGMSRMVDQERGSVRAR